MTYVFRQLATVFIVGIVSISCWAEDTYSSQSWSVGGAGASIQIANRISVDIPKCALENDIALTITLTPLSPELKRTPMNSVVVGDYIAEFSPKIVFKRPIEIRFHYRQTDVGEHRHESGFSIGRLAPSGEWFAESSLQGDTTSESGPGGEHNTKENWISLYTDYWEGHRIIFSGG